MAPTARLTAHDRVIRQQLDAGMTLTDIAKSLRVPRTTLSSHLNKPSLAHRPRYATPRADRPLAGGQVTHEEVLAAENRELRLALLKDRRSSVAEERIVRAVTQAAEHLSPPNEVWLTPAEPTTATGHHRQVLLLSDFHGGEVVDPDAVNGLNAYNWEIQEQRVDELIAGFLSHKRHSPTLTGLDVLFVGDMCSGANHQEIAETNEYPLAEQAVKMGYLQASIIRRLAVHVPDVRVGLVVGNHPRLAPKPASKRVHDNGDWIAGVVMAENLKDCENVTCTISRGASLFWSVAGRTCYVWHGDGVRSTMIGVPFGGVMRRVNEIARQHEQRIDHFIYGHFHSATVVQGGRIIGNGSLKGTDEWCQKSFGSGDPPTQLLLTFDEERERLTDVRYLTPSAGVKA